MKKTLVILVALLASVLNANAQFEEGTKYLNASMSNINLNYNGSEKLSFGAQIRAGYFISDGWMLNALVDYSKDGKGIPGVLEVGAGIRYNVVQNGLYAGLNAKMHFTSGNTDIMPGLELGYSFFLNDKVAIEPAVYYDQSFHGHKDYSNVGFRIGIGCYL